MPLEGWDSISLKTEEIELIDDVRRGIKRKEIPSRRDVIVEAVQLLAKKQGITAES